MLCGREWYVNTLHKFILPYMEPTTTAFNSAGMRRLLEMDVMIT